MTEQTPRGFRPIAPRTRLLGGGDGGEGAANPAGGGAPEERRMRRASTACTECQKRRTRCSGPPVCAECLAHGRECIFDESSDRRRKASAKRTMDQLDYYRSFLEDLLGIIRDSADETVQYLFNTVRAGATNGQIRDTLTSIMEDENEPIARNSDVRNSNLNLDITSNNNEGNYFNPPR